MANKSTVTELVEKNSEIQTQQEIKMVDGSVEPVEVLPLMNKLRSITEIIKDLSKEIAPRHLKSRKQGGATLLYIPWYQAVRYLDLYAPGWYYDIINVNSVGGKTVVTSKITIPCAEGLVYRSATGQEEAEGVKFGDSTSNAESMSLRRCAAKFGLGLYLYDK